MAVAILVLATLASTVGPATAVAPPNQASPYSVWVQPGTGNLDGLGNFLYVAPPAPGATQASPLSYAYTLRFNFEGGSSGLVAVAYKDGQRVTGFITPGNETTFTPYNWAYGHIYYLLTYRLSPTQWGAWIYDWSAGTWTLIGVQTVAGSVGRMLPASYTSVQFWEPAPAPAADPNTCAYYPRIDAFWYPPMGWRGDVITNATLQSTETVSQQCAINGVTTENGWQHYTLGTPA